MLNSKNIVLVILIISLSLQIILPDGIYIINMEKYYLNYHREKILISNYFSKNSFFRITNAFENNSYYYIKQSKTNNKLTYSKNQKTVFFSEKSENKFSLWHIIKRDNNYLIKNKNECYIIIINNNIICDNIPLNKATRFNISKIYEEVVDNKYDNDLIEKEPIDVLIKYIDLRDPELKRGNIHQIKKDYDNEELRYSIRSILKNIPWVRKIYILMPNKKVRYFKDYKSIKDKIIYINDKEFLGHDSSNSNSFQFNYWKMYKYGISKNFIIMDDDCFIGKSLKKQDFFYVEKGKVVPLIITSNIIKIEKKTVKIKKDLLKKKAISSKNEQNSIIYFYSLSLTYLFILNIFKKKNLFIPRTTHNAIPVNLKELKAIYKIVLNSHHKSTTLDSLYRDINSLQFQSFALSYMFIKYNKKVKNLSHKYIDIKKVHLNNYNSALYCINTGGLNYSTLNFHKAKIVMNNLFPVPTPYENIDYTLSNITLNPLKTMDNNTIKCTEENYKNYQKNNDIINKLDIFHFSFLMLLIIIVKYSIKYLFLNLKL